MLYVGSSATVSLHASIFFSNTATRGVAFLGESTSLVCLDCNQANSGGGIASSSAVTSVNRHGLSSNVDDEAELLPRQNLDS